MFIDRVANTATASVAAAIPSWWAHLTIHSCLQLARWRRRPLLLQFSVLPPPTPGGHLLHYRRARCLPGLLPQGTASLLVVMLVRLLLAHTSAALLLILVLVLHEGQALLQGWAVLGPLPLLQGLPRPLPPAWHWLLLLLLLLLLHQRQPLLQAGEALQSVQVCDWLGRLRAPAACTGRLLPPRGVVKAELHVLRACATTSRAPEGPCWVQSAPLPALLLPVTIIVVCLPRAPAWHLLLPAGNTPATVVPPHHLKYQSMLAVRCSAWWACSGLQDCPQAHAQCSCCCPPCTPHKHRLQAPV